MLKSPNLKSLAQQLYSFPSCLGHFSLDVGVGQISKLSEEYTKEEDGIEIVVPVTEEDTDGNGYQEHEYTPESSYYISNGTGNNNVCGAMSSPIEPDR